MIQFLKQLWQSYKDKKSIEEQYDGLTAEQIMPEGYWTQEELDRARLEGQRIAEEIEWE